MRILLDEQAPRAFGRLLGSHEVSTVRYLGWTGVGNGELLRQAGRAGFDALITLDRNLEYQQNISQAGIGVIVLIAPSNRIADLRPLAAQTEQALASIQPGQLIHIGTEYWKKRGNRP